MTEKMMEYSKENKTVPKLEQLLGELMELMKD